jgi:hypothetical protein
MNNPHEAQVQIKMAVEYLHDEINEHQEAVVAVYAKYNINGIGK